MNPSAYQRASCTQTQQQPDFEPSLSNRSFKLLLMLYQARCQILQRPAPARFSGCFRSRACQKRGGICQLRSSDARGTSWFWQAYTLQTHLSCVVRQFLAAFHWIPSPSEHQV